MKHGKFILGAAALVITAANALAFRAAHKNGQPNGFIKTIGGGCKLSTCFISVSSGSGVFSCKTLPNKVKSALGTCWTTSSCVNRQVLCTHTN